LKAFSLFHRILDGASNITKRRSFSADFSQGNSKIQLHPSQESVEDAVVLSLCYLLRNPSTKPTSVLEHCREGETICWFSFIGGVSF